MTITDFKNKEHDARQKKLAIKIGEQTDGFINIVSAYTADTLDQIELIKNDASDPNSRKINNLFISRNMFLEYVDQLKLDPPSKMIVEKMVQTIVRQSADNLIRSDVLEELAQNIEITKDQRDYLKRIIMQQSGANLEEIDRKLNLGVDLNKYANRPKDLKKLIEKTYRKK